MHLTKLSGAGFRIVWTDCMDKNDIPAGFDAPTALPHSPEEAARWQQANRDFWQNNPMRYDWRTAVGMSEFSPEFYREIDTRFLNDVVHYMPWKSLPFEAIIPFDKLAGKDVLEIGVGCGTHAQIIAPRVGSYTGIDLTDYAVRCTAKRLESSGIQAKVQQMDAENMSFADNSFDFIWTWGVIHHSSNTRKILEQMNRVLRPRGRATVMVYHRSLWHYYVLAGFFNGILRGQVFREKSLHRVLQRNIDGALARFYRPREWACEIEGLFRLDRLRIYGSKTELIPLPGGKLKTVVLKLTPDSVGRLFTNRLRFGLFLVAEMTVTK
jgi:SAM-dependent methyltransferase